MKVREFAAESIWVILREMWERELEDDRDDCDSIQQWSDMIVIHKHRYLLWLSENIQATENSELN